MSCRWNGSSVMAEFEKIAADRGLISSDLAPSDEKDVVGNPHKDNPEWTRHKETEDYDVTGGTGTGIIEKAHPSPVTVADAMGEGALVENQVEQHQKDVDIATRKMPRGTLVGIHASLASELLKLAASLDAAGDEEAARKVDASVRRLVRRPFGPEGISKTAFLSAIWAALKGLSAMKWVMTALSLGGAQKFFNFTGITETLHEDLKDLADVAGQLQNQPETSKLASEIIRILKPYANSFQIVPVPGSPEHGRFMDQLTRFSRDLPRLKALVQAAATADSGHAVTRFLGVSDGERLKDKLASVEKGYKRLAVAYLKAAQVGKKALSSGKPAAGAVAPGLGGLKGVQALVGAKPTGVLDEQTKAKLRETEARMEKNLAPLLKQKDLTVKGMLLRPDGSVIGVQQLRRLIALEHEFRLRGKVR